MDSFTMTKAQLDKVLAQFPEKMVSRSATICTVKGKRKSDGEIVTLLSAAHGWQGWSVITVPGLITAEVKK